MIAIIFLLALLSLLITQVMIVIKNSKLEARLHEVEKALVKVIKKYQTDSIKNIMEEIKEVFSSLEDLEIKKNENENKITTKKKNSSNAKN